VLGLKLPCGIETSFAIVYRLTKALVGAEEMVRIMIEAIGVAIQL
jgi:hypothetical protein